MAGVHETIALEDAHDILIMMVQLGRLIPPNEWVDEWRLESEGKKFAGFGV